MPRCYYHPEKGAYKTCNYCQRPVCQSCIWDYSTTLCVECYTNFRTATAYEKYTNVRNAFIIYGVFVVMFFLVIRLEGRGNLFEHIVESLIVGIGGFLWIPLCKLFSKKISLVVCVISPFVVIGVIEKIIPSILATLFMLLLPVILVTLHIYLLKRNYKSYLAEREECIQILNTYDGMRAKDYHQNRSDYNEGVDEEGSTYDHNYGATNHNNQRSETNFFAGCTTEESIKKRYKELVVIYHPDKQNGDTHMLQMINSQYEQLRKSP